MQLHRFYYGSRNWPSPSWLGLWQVQVKSPSESPSWPSTIVFTSLAPKSKPTFPSTLEFDPSLPLSLGHHLFFIYSEFCEAKSGPYSDLTRRGSGGGVTMLYFHGHYSSFIVHTYQGGVCEVQGCQQRNKYQYTAFHVYWVWLSSGNQKIDLEFVWVIFLHQPFVMTPCLYKFLQLLRSHSW